MDSNLALGLGVLAIAGASVVGKKVAEKVTKPKPLIDDFGWREASETYDVPIPLLIGIALTESSGNPKAVNKTLNRDGSADYGLMQINGTMLKRLGLDTNSALDGRKSLMAGAKLLHLLRGELGIPTKPRNEDELERWIGAYNMGSPRLKKYGPEVARKYIDKVKKNMRKAEGVYLA